MSQSSLPSTDLTGAGEVMQNDSKPPFNAFHYIIVGVFGFFAGSFGGFILFAVLAVSNQRFSDESLFLSVLWGGILGATGLPMLLRASSR
jgi:hypothetical protein